MWTLRGKTKERKFKVRNKETEKTKRYDGKGTSRHAERTPSFINSTFQGEKNSWGFKSYINQNLRI